MTERIFERGFVLKAALPAALIIGCAFALTVMAFGLESVASGVHDALHDFRHVIGMPCH